MKIGTAHRVRYFSIALAYVLVLVAGLMALVMSTAKDRANYLVIFSNPFGNSRIEIGFQYYVDALEHLNVPPAVGIVITCVLTYMILAYAWYAWVRIYWIESLLLFNFFVFSLFNYYLGTSIRMGLATALALYGAVQIARGNRKFLVLVWISGLFQYGTIPFSLIVTWLVLTQRVSWRIHKVFILAASIALPLSVALILRHLGLSGHYMSYFNGSEGQTGRIFPFTYAFLVLALVLSSFKGEDTILRRAAFYGLPFLLYGIFSGVAIFSKMLIPNIFIASMVITSDYWNAYVKNVGPNFRLFFAVALNGLAMLYALRAYQYI